MKYINSLIIIIIIGLGLISCGSGGSTEKSNTAQRGEFVSGQKLVSHSLKDMQSSINKSGGERFLIPKYPVDIYKITYKTITPHDKIINASGIVAVPKKATNALSPRVAYHHGTILSNKEAPSSNVSASAPEAIAATLGYIMISPDYVGYGASAKQPHPYLHEKTLAAASVDLLTASKQWMKDNKIKINKQLFITGYSEGGYAALATQKSLEGDFNTTITAAVPAEGPYDVSGTGALLPTITYLAYPVSVAYMIKNIDSIYANGIVKEAIKPAFIPIFDRYFDGTHTAAEINKLLGNDPKTWIKQSFLDGITNGSNKTFIPIMKENNIYDWKPKAPTRLFHGKDDQVVPYSNASLALKKMTANKAPDVKIINCSSAIPGLTITPTSHAKCATPYFFYIIFYFAGKAKNL